MSFSNFSDFLSMGGHGLYVWLCYSVGLVLFIGIFAQSFAQRKNVIKELAQRYRRQELESAKKLSTDE